MPIVRVASGFRLPFEAARLLRRERSVWQAALVPLAVSVASIALGITAVVVWAGELWALANAWLPWPEVAAWWSWAWVAPLRFLITVVAAVAFAGIAGAIVVVAFLIGGIVASPLLDRLSRRVEESLTGSAADVSAPGFGALTKGAARSAFEEAKRIGFFLAAQAMIAIPGAIVPGLQPPAAVAMVALTVVFLALDSASYALDRRGLRFGDKLRWGAAHWPRVGGYGLAAFALCSIPGLNLLALPLLVISGTLLVVDTERAAAPKR